MARTVRYRLRSPIGGLTADLTAEIRQSTDSVAPDIQVYGKLRLALPPGGLHWKDAAWLSFGVALNAREVNARFPDGVTIRVLALDMPLSDYRAEVAALAMDLWLREECGLPMNGVAAVFSASAGDYVFSWGDVENPFSDPTTRVRPA
ncbi:hypothetical protein ACIHAR_31415 [Streptomyces sp. NPDC052016]|uniref:hypothetical protein n=1 Tax=Streptomyces sp. NPDC052016 TaxID=3365680 RepID=UPI0037D02F45